MSLLEMLVAVGILVIVMFAVGALFQTTSRAVGMSQALLEMMSNVRAVQDQMSRDVASMDKDGFLIIRSRVDAAGRRVDQVSFLGLGAFTTPVESHVAANAAHIWWGHLAMGDDGAEADQSAALPLDALPTSTLEKGLTLGRHVTLLLAPNSQGRYPDAAIPCFSGVSQATPPLAYSSEPPADITSARIGCAAITPSQIMALIRMGADDPRRDPGYEAYTASYCYRFKSLASPYGSKVSLANGVARMSPIALQGVGDFKVEWTNRSDAGGDMIWYGLGDPQSASPSLNEPAPADGDAYVAIFSFDTARDQWPSALRVTFELSDPNHRLGGTRTFTQILKLPD